MASKTSCPSRAPLAARLIAAALLIPAAARAEQQPIVAVFQVQDRSGQLSAESVQQITDYLATRLGEGGVLRVLPRGQIRAQLRQQKRESYRACYDQQCQIEIGRELAAQKTVSSQIVRIGSRCAVLLTLFDLRRAAAERSSSQKAACEQDALIAALDRATAAILAKQPAEAERTAQARATLALRSRPYNAAVQLDGRPSGRTPTELTVAPGSHRVSIALEGYAPAERSVAAEPGQTLVVDVELAPLRPDASVQDGPKPAPPVQPAAAAKPTSAKPTFRHRYIGVIAGLQAGITDAAPTVGDVRLLIGGRRFTFEGGAHFGDGLIGGRAGIVGQLPLRPSDKLPLFIIPTLGYSYTYNAVDEAGGSAYHDVMIYTPGVRLRYDLFDRLALIADLIQVDISVIRIIKPPGSDEWDEQFGGVQWNIQAGAALLL